MRGDDDGFAVVEAHLHRATLDGGQLLEGALDAEVAARDHERVGGAHDVVEIGDGRLVLDLGDDARVGFVDVQKLAQRVDVGALAHEGERHVVDALLDADERVGAVLLGEGGQVHLHAGEIDVAAGFQLAGREHAATDVGVLFFQDLQADEAVVHQHGVADLDVVDQIAVVHVHRAHLLGVVAGRAGLYGKVKNLAGGEQDGVVHVAGADLGTLDVHHDGDLSADLGRDRADAANDGAAPLVLGVGHVQAGDIGAGANDFFQHLFGLGRGTEGEDDFGATKRGERRMRGGHGRQAAKGVRTRERARSRAPTVIGRLNRCLIRLPRSYHRPFSARRRAAAGSSSSA